MDNTHQPPDWENMKQAVLPEETMVLQHLQQTAVGVLPVCGSQHPVLRCGVLGRPDVQEGHYRQDELMRGASSMVRMKLDSLVRWWQR